MEPFEIAETGAAEYATRRATLVARLLTRGVMAAVITDPRDMVYLIGYPGATPLGPNPFAGGCSAALVLTTADDCVLVVGRPDPWMIDLNAGPVEVRPFDTFSDLTPLRPRGRFGVAVAEALAGASLVSSARIGYDAASLPALALEAIEKRFSQTPLVDIGAEVAAVRMQKSPGELDALRRSISICDAAQAAAAATAAPGVGQEQLFATIRGAVEAETGTATPILIEASYGGNFGADGAERALRDGDLLVVDIAPRVAGYWGDSCNTHVIGEPTDETRHMLEVIREALALGTAAVRPGVSAGAVDAVMREHVAHHFPAYDGSGGHGIGVDFHEPPRLIPGEQTQLETDMVIALEPGIYLEHACARLEHLVRVVPEGCEVLSRHLIS